MSAALPRSAAGDHNPWLIAIVVSLATFMEVLDTSIANVALRNIAGSLAAGQDESTWVLTSYLVSNAVVLPIAGWLSEVIGRKRFYILCVGLFTASSFLCALAPSLEFLIFFRVLQGIGGGGLAPTSQSMLADSFVPAQRALAFSVYGIAIIVAPTIGPTLGGWLTDSFSWHWIFLINVPVGIASILLVQALVDEPEALKEDRRRLLERGIRVDYVGFILVAVWLGCLEVVLDKGQQEDWFGSGFIVLFASISFLALVLFVPWELSREDPIVDIRLLGHRHFGTCCLVMLAVGMILFSSTQFIPQLLQTTYGYTATLSGLVLMPAGMLMLVLMPVAGRLAGLIQPRYLIMGGMAATAFAMWYLSSFSQDAGFSYFAWARMLQTVGLPFLFVPLTSTSYEGLPPDKTGAASSILNVARNLGGSIGIAMATTLLARREQFHHVRLAESVVPTSPALQRTIEAGRGHFDQFSSSAADTQHQVMAWIAQTVQQQATLLSYGDVFLALGVLALVMVPTGLLLSRVRGGAPAAG